jgi:hypothetical protein
MEGRLLLVVSCWDSDFDWSDGSASLSILLPISPFAPLDLNSLDDEPRNRMLVLCSSFDDESAGIIEG